MVRLFEHIESDRRLFQAAVVGLAPIVWVLTSATASVASGGTADSWVLSGIVTTMAIVSSFRSLLAARAVATLCGLWSALIVTFDIGVAIARGRPPFSEGGALVVHGLAFVVALACRSLLLQTRTGRANANAQGTVVPQARGSMTLVALAVGTVATSLFLGLVNVGGGAWIKDRLLSRGPIPPITTFFFFWALAIMTIKVYRLIREHHYRGEVLTLVALAAAPTELGPLAQAMPEKAMRFSYPYRLAMCADAKAAQESWDRPVARLDTASFADHAYLDTSYLLLRYLIWAMPVMGFLGTVWGISACIEDFIKVFRQTPSIKMAGEEAIAALAPLAVAFDTTVVALSFSIVAMLLASLVQRMEEDFLTTSDVYFQRLLQSKT